MRQGNGQLSGRKERKKGGVKTNNYLAKKGKIEKSGVQNGQLSGQKEKEKESEVQWLITIWPKKEKERKKKMKIRSKKKATKRKLERQGQVHIPPWRSG